MHKFDSDFQDDTLFLHGTYVRKLSEKEVNDFKNYQKNLTVFNEYYEKYGSTDVQSV